MLLNEQQIEEAKDRADQVVNGFATVKMQQARDALSLAETLQLRNKQLANLLEEIKKRAAARSNAGGIDDIFGDIFGESVFGKGGSDFFGKNSPFGGNGFGQKK